MKSVLRLAIGVALILSFASLALAQPCEVPDNGSGTVDLPPDGCAYLSPNDVHEIIDGLPPGTTIRLDPIHSRFFNSLVIPGGPLGGATETFDSFIDFQVTGTGDLAGFNRLLSIQVQCQTATAPRANGQAVQSFDTEMVQLTGSLVGDPDFQSLTITGGNVVGPGTRRCSVWALRGATSRSTASSTSPTRSTSSARRAASWRVFRAAPPTTC